jgi:triphosphoribosyl-dephospho-CoA synthetase
MTAEFDSSKYRLLMVEALEAYRTDSSYAEDMARQAGALLARQEARRERDAVDMETISN